MAKKPGLYEFKRRISTHSTQRHGRKQLKIAGMCDSGDLEIERFEKKKNKNKNRRVRVRAREGQRLASGDGKEVKCCIYGILMADKEIKAQCFLRSFF